MSKGSSIDGMVGMHALSRRLACNHILLARPLLNFRKEQLRTVCKEAGLEWVEDKTNMSPHFTRNFIRLRLREDPELVEGFLQLHNTLETVRDELSKKGELVENDIYLCVYRRFCSNTMFLQLMTQ